MHGGLAVGRQGVGRREPAADDITGCSRAEHNAPAGNLHGAPHSLEGCCRSGGQGWRKVASLSEAARHGDAWGGLQVTCRLVLTQGCVMRARGCCNVRGFWGGGHGVLPGHRGAATRGKAPSSLKFVRNFRLFFRCAHSPVTTPHLRRRLTQLSLRARDGACGAGGTHGLSLRCRAHERSSAG